VRRVGAADAKRLQSRLRQVRLTAALTQVQLAKKLGVTQDFVSKYETGERRLDAIELLHVLRALKVDAISFLREFM
jgi:transcriptional regulator with XRE-family HTH domain